MRSAVSDLVRGSDGRHRCRWGASTPDYETYHDGEWGRPVVDDIRIYEKLCLEGFQSGLPRRPLLPLKAEQREDLVQIFRRMNSELTELS